jgi:hypothetical protein
MDLDVLADKEQALLQRLQRLGDEGVRDGQDHDDIQQRYSEIYHCLVSMLSSESRRLEALKRAVYLQWIALLEPPQVTGMIGPGRETASTVLATVDKALREGWYDEELEWMLRWCNSITPWYFDGYRSLPDLGRLLATEDPDIDLAQHLDLASLPRRGQMGSYFGDMAAEMARRHRHEP